MPRSPKQPPNQPPNQTVQRLRAVMLDTARWLRGLPLMLRTARGPAAMDRHIILHVGAHKTGTTTIQTMLRLNRRRLATHVLVLARRDFPTERLSRATRGWTPPEDWPALERRLKIRARRLARWTRHAPVVVVSHEDLLGTRPTLWGRKGLYTQGPEKLGVIVRALRAEGMRVTVALGLREIDDWTGSLQRDVTGAAPETPQEYRARHDLPDTWDGLLARIAAETGAAPHVLCFEDEAPRDRLGDGLLRLAGVPQAVLDDLQRPPAQRVTKERQP